MIERLRSLCSMCLLPIVLLGMPLSWAGPPPVEAYRLLSAQVVERTASGQRVLLSARCVQPGCWGDMDDLLYYDPDRGAAIDTGTEDYHVIDASGQRHDRLTGAMDDTQVTVVLEVWVPPDTRRLALGYVNEVQSRPIALRKP